MQPLVPPGLPSVEQARARIIEALAPLEPERVQLEHALGRYLAETIEAERDAPAHTISQMDGYAVRADDIAAAGEQAPVELPVVMRIAAGDTPSAPLEPNQAARIFTGAPLPAGADTVVPQEWTEALRNEAGAIATVRVEQAPPLQGAFVRPRGSDFKAGETMLGAGERLHAGALALAAACGRGRVLVTRRPRVALIATGDELLGPGQPWRAGAVYETNRLLLGALLREAGAEVIDFGIVADQPKTLRAHLSAAFERADMVVTTGGVSVGEEDHLKAVAESLGVERRLWRVRVRPGKPLYFGVLRDGAKTRPVGLLGLPGNPGSVLTTLVLFVLPALRHLQGARRIGPRTHEARLFAPVDIVPGRRTYLRARRRFDEDGVCLVEALGRQSSGSVRANASTDALIEFDEAGGRFPAGSVVSALPLFEAP